MSFDLTQRQIKLLEAIIGEYSKSFEPVGSKTIVKKYALKVSPATVRNEMAHLLEDGFLEMMHTSSGRVPTARAFRFFIKELMEENDLDVLQEVAIKQRLWPQRFELEKLLRQSVLSLADVTKNLAIAITKDGFVTHAGAVNVLDHPEFWDIDVAKSALNLLDKSELLADIFKNAVQNAKGVSVMIGDDIGHANLEQCSLIVAPFKAGSNSGYIGVLGPTRMQYASIVPAVRYTKSLVEDLTKAW